MMYGCVRTGRLISQPCARCIRPGDCEKKMPHGITAAKREINAALDLGTFEPVFMTIKRVPIVMAGVEYQLASGPATFTPEDIQEFVASQDDPAIVSPRLKIGHTSRLSNPKADGILKDGDDGVPALGKFVNITFDDQNITALGDLAGVPLWLAKLLKAGLLYPSRSIEGFQEAQTVTGHVWGLVVQAVALLGCVWPGCSTLDDLPLLYTEEGPDDIELYDAEGKELDVSTIRARLGHPVAAASEVNAAVNVDDVRRAYYDSLNADQMWWWIRAIYVDPNELIVDDDEGQLYRVAYTISGDEVEFADASPVRIQYVDAATSPTSRHLRAQLASALNAADKIAASYTSREESRPNPEQEANSMTRAEQIAQLRARLGLTAEQLPDNATDAQLAAAALQASETPATPPEGTPPNDQTQTSEVTTPPGEEPEEDEPTTPPEGGDAATASLPDGMVAIPASTWAEVQRNAAAGASVAASHAEERREAMINAALTAGKIRPADVASYRNMFANAASAGVAETLLTKGVEEGGLMAGIVPVTERGDIPSGDGSPGTGDDVSASYDPTWLSPQEQARVAAVKGGTYQAPQVQTDDPRRAQHAAVA